MLRSRDHGDGTALAHLVGASPDELLGAPFSGNPTSPFADTTDAILRCLDDGVQRTVQQRHVDPLDGERIHEVRLVPEFGTDGRVESVLGIGRDITEVVRQGEALERSSRTDPLAGMSSRQAAGGRLALLLVDLDGFKHLNDRYGHRLGDRILRHVGTTLTGCMGDGDLLVRLGGDEFVLLIAQVESPTDASLLAHQARMQLAHIDIDGDVRFPALDASVGVAIFPDDGTGADVLLAHADMALYDAKRAGRGRVAFFRHELRAAMERRSSIEQALRDCVPDTQMALHLQPICTLDPEPRVWGAEALLRWHHPVLGVVPPRRVHPDRRAERSDRADRPLGAAPRRRGRRRAQRRSNGSAPDHRERVDAPVHPRRHRRHVRAALGSAGCDPSWIVLELTESLLLEDVPLVHRALEQVRPLGVRVAIDDFGTGYSALHHLTKLRIDHMKIDKTFVRDADVDHQQQEIVRALVAMASALDIGIVAEGIETCGQAEFLRSLGCHLGQGYLLARPMPFDGFRAWLDTSAVTLRAALPV